MALKGNTFLVKQGIIQSSDIVRLHYRARCIEKSSEIAPDAMKLSHIHIVNAQKGHKKSSTGELLTWTDLEPDLFSVVIVDEAHHLPAKQWGDIISRFKDFAKVIFLTATPFRSDKKNITEDLPNTGLAYHLPRREAVEKRIIRPVNPMGLDPHTRYDASKQVTKAFEILPIIKWRLKQKNDDQKLPGNKQHMAILVASSIEYAKQISEEWNKQYSPLNAQCIHSDMTDQEKKAVKQNLRDGKITLLVIVQMLLEGFDHPPISVAAIATKIVSPVKFTQFIGRAQRILSRCRW